MLLDSMPPALTRIEWPSSVQCTTKGWPSGNTATALLLPGWPWTQCSRASERGNGGHKLNLRHHWDCVVPMLKSTHMWAKEGRKEGRRGTRRGNGAGTEVILLNQWLKGSMVYRLWVFGLWRDR